MKLSVIIPIYNEKKTVLQLIDKVEKVDLGKVSKELILVDDFSTDGTREILKQLKKSKNRKLILHKKNGGKGTATRTGLKHVTGDIIIVQDADLEYNPEEYKKLIQPILKGKTKVVYGSRFLKKGTIKKKKGKLPIPTHYIGNRFLSLMTQLLYFRKITDMETCYKMFRKEVLEGINLKAKRFEFEPEITAKIIKKGYRIIEIPITYNSRDFSEGKKIDWKDGIKALLWLLRFRFFN